MSSYVCAWVRMFVCVHDACALLCVCVCTNPVSITIMIDIEIT